MKEKTIHKHKGLKRLLIGLVIFLLLFSAGSMIAVKLLYDNNFKRTKKIDPRYTGHLTYQDVTGYERTKVEFLSGKNTLTGYIYGENNTKGLVVISHGLGFTAESYLPETLYFVDNGWRVLAYDNTGVDESEGKSCVGLAQSVIDLDAALTFVENNSGLKDLPVMLYGHSWGGYAVTAILNYDHKVSAVASLAGYNSPYDHLKEQSIDMMGFFAYVEYPYLCAYQRMLFGKTASLTAVDGINKAGIPVMIIHGNQDETIKYDGASIISRQKEITDPKAVFLTNSSEGHNGHNNLNVSEASVEYIDGKNKEYKKTYDQYNGKVPEDIRAEYYKGVNKALVSQLDPAFMGQINLFFEATLE